MVHPYFDPGPFPWPRPDAQEFHRQLGMVVANVDLIGLYYQQAGGRIEDLNTNKPPRDVWRDALELLATAGRIAALCDVLAELPALQANRPFQDAIQLVRSARPAVQRRFFDEENIVLDRDPLRDLITITQSETSRMNIIVVRGAPKSGRSHGALLFELAARDRGAEAVYACAGPITTVEDLIDQIRVPLFGVPADIRPRDTTEEAWFQSVCVDLQSLAERNRRRLWIAVDDLGVDADNAPLLDARVRRFCEQFAMNMLNPAFRKWFRLLLIDYPGPVPTKWKSQMWREDVPTAQDVGAAQILDFLKDWAADRAVFTDADLDAVVTDLLAEIDAAGPVPPDPWDSRLQRLNDGVIRRIRALSARIVPP